MELPAIGCMYDFILNLLKRVVGTYKLEGEEVVIETVLAALKLGYRHIGTFHTS